VFFVFVECASSKEYGFFPLAILEGFALFEGFPATFCMISVTRFAKPLLGLFLGRFDDVQVLCLFGVKRPESHACFGLAKDTGSSKQLLHLLRKESGILEIPFVRVVPVFFVIPNASLFASPGFESEVGSLQARWTVAKRTGMALVSKLFHHGFSVISIALDDQFSQTCTRSSVSHVASCI
jgi:hypothetical protein